ncbi:MAG: metallophosphoesterase [Pygmaiobacter massiliensis]|nr:metallophosphoesterase [Pygmaiobacter massiliensis]
MSIYAIADLHLSLGKQDKPMDIFRGWQGYVQRLEKNWRSLICSTDTVVLPGDISWAMNLDDAVEDFAFLESLPGTKIILKGNHDYWWNTMSKMNAFLEKNSFGTIRILNNTCHFAEGVAICGTRSWLFDVAEEHNAKIMNRELGRLAASLDAAGDTQKLVFLHYPPIYPNGNADEVVAMLHQYGIKQCFYGHLHGASIAGAVEGEVDGICYKLISADALRFCPLKIQ